MKAEIIVFIERNTFNVPFRKPSFEHEWIEFGETTQANVVERLAPATDFAPARLCSAWTETRAPRAVLA